MAGPIKMKYLLLQFEGDALGRLAYVAGLAWRRAGEVVENEPRALIRDLDHFPYADRTSLPIDYIESLPLDVPAVLSLDKFCTMQTSRGCPYTCIYCDIPTLAQGKWRSPTRYRTTR